MALIDIHNHTGEIDRTAGLKEIIRDINKEQKLNRKHTIIDLFSGDGSFCSYILWEIAAQMDCVVYDESAIAEVRKKIPKANVIHGDACVIARDTTKNYEIVFCDNPQGILPNKTCEYFELLVTMPKLVKKGGYLIHNINVRPYNFDSSSEWASCRRAFYKSNQIESLDINLMTSFHENMVRKQGFNIQSVTAYPREIYQGKIYLYFLLYRYN